jgi:hypothetical protein
MYGVTMVAPHNMSVPEDGLEQKPHGFIGGDQKR